MNYIIVDFEWNQPMPEQPMIRSPFPLDSEIIEIGAIRLNEQFVFEAEYKAYVKPVFYPVMNGKVVRLTKIRPQELEKAACFPEVCGDFLNWCGDSFCLCTWGSDDVPVFLDNMLIHGMEPPVLFDTCDLQQIYSREVMRDEKRWSLEKAVDLLGLPKERAHDALNDVRNTITICERVDVLAYLDEYACRYVDYGKDRMAGLSGGREYPGFEEAFGDPALAGLCCPYCGEALLFGEWLRQNRNAFLRYASCGEGDEFLGRFRCGRSENGGLTVGRQVFEMNDVLWEDYQTAVEKNSEREAE